MRLANKKITLSITGSIAAYKAATLTRLLMKEGAEVRVLMTPAAQEFISPLTLSTLSKNPVFIESFDNHSGAWNSHVDMGLWSDLMLIAPATANTLAKMAHGVADNLVLTAYLSAKCRVLIAPAMDLDMYKHPSTQSNLELLRSYGNQIIEAQNGELASGLIGKGRMEEPEVILEYVCNLLSEDQSLQGKKVLITAGPTFENIDPVRFIGNYSSGKMGYALAEECAKRGAEVNLISGPVSLVPIHSRINRHSVVSAQEMYEAVMHSVSEADYVLCCAAVADFTPEMSPEKIKSNPDGLTLHLKPNPDIAQQVGQIKKPQQCLVGFALETDAGVDSAKQKMKKKNLDLIVLNSLSNKGAGFTGDTNQVSIITKEGSQTDYPLQSKTLVARDVINAMLKVVLLFLGLWLTSTSLRSQELKCSVTVSYNKIQGTNTKIYKTLEGSIASLMNGQRWTSLPYTSKERIECNLFLNIVNRDGDNFSAELQIQSRRPVFNSSYNTTMLNHKDNELTFNYKEFDPLIFNQNQIESNLVGVLAFYAYYIIALDQDSYTLNGGDDYYKKADQIVSQGQNTPYSGWKAFEGKNKYNRYWMTQEVLNNDFVSYRKFLYTYHLQGLDVMADDPDLGRKNIGAALSLLQDTNQKAPSSMLLQMLFNAKADEITAVFSKGSKEECIAASKILREVDPTRVSKYNSIIKQ